MRRNSKLVVRLFAGLLILWALLLYYPIRNGFSRAAILATFTGCVVCLVLMLWRHKWSRWAPLAIPAIFAALLLLPGRPVNRVVLRAAYVTELQSYKETRYVWGGENWRGVDCSGLLRSALVDAQFRQSFHTLNPALARQALWFWWHDASAHDLRNGYQGQTSQLGSPIPLKDVPPDLLLPGDFAVTADGSHVLAYFGNGRWIEADPYALRVIELSPGMPSEWWIVNVVPCRWQCLGVQ